MKQNLFVQLQEKKQIIYACIDKGLEYNWITEAEARSLITNLDKSEITIGVIGQMKAGKSTFLNSFIFEDSVLPAATTPMTAALSVITYGEEKKLIAEFYSQEEWEEQKLQASRSLAEVAGAPLEESKVRAAKELVASAVKLGSSINEYLGTTKEDSLDNLEEYVGANGKYVSITKSVTIHYPKEYLKGVKIVDTPGFNDPIVSREERTKQFLSRADVVVLLVYAGRPFDATDKEILFKNVASCGIGKVILAINKFDIPYENGETEEEIVEYVEAEINKASKERQNNDILDIIKEIKPIALSAEMALLSSLPMSTITADETKTHIWKRVTQIFEVSSQAEIRAKSNIDTLTAEIRNLIDKEKSQVLFRKPITFLAAAALGYQEQLYKLLLTKKESLSNYSLTDDELMEKERSYSKLQKRIKKSINFINEQLEMSLIQLVKKSKEDLYSKSSKGIDKIIDGVKTEYGVFTNSKEFLGKVDLELNRLSRDLKYTLNSKIPAETKGIINKRVDDELNVVEGYLLKYMPELETKYILSNISVRIDKLLYSGVFTEPKSTVGTELDGFKSMISLNYPSINSVIKAATWIGFYKYEKTNLLSYLRKLAKDFHPDEVLSTIIDRKDEICNIVTEKLLKELVEPIISDLKAIQTEIKKKDSSKLQLEQEIAQLEADIARVDAQISDFNRLKSELK